MTLEFRVLGPLEALRDGERLDLGAPKQRALLAILLLGTGQVVPVERLIDELWEDPPAAAHDAVHVYVSRLRKVLEPGRRARTPGEQLVRRGTGYALLVEPGGLDLGRFERLAAEATRAMGSGDAATASRSLAEALALWRGPALSDLVEEPFARREAGRLDELRIGALTERIEADLALGRAEELVPELEALVARHPTRERLRGQLMLALYRAGRQGDALEAYRAARRALVEDLGVEPGPALRRLEGAVLRQDPGLDVAPAAAAHADRAVLALAGDAAGLDRLLALAAPLTRARPSRELVLVVLAAPGAPALARATELAHGRRQRLAAAGVATRAVALASAHPGEDVLRLVGDEAVDLLLVDGDAAVADGADLPPAIAEILELAPCDVALWVGSPGPGPTAGRPVMVPFGGSEDDWAAVEVAAWAAAALGVPLALAGSAAAGDDGRDAGRLLARASLLLQRVTGVAARPVLAEPGPEGMLVATRDAGLVVVGVSPRWRKEGLGETRLVLVRRGAAPTLLVRRGSRPGGLAPSGTITRFRWSVPGRVD